MARRVWIGKDAVARIWSDHNLKPWKVDTFMVSDDPRFEEKLVDVVGLNLNPDAAAPAGSARSAGACRRPPTYLATNSRACGHPTRRSIPASSHSIDSGPL
jgi:hypothetical protein